jgi:hypothetical protein
MSHIRLATHGICYHIHICMVFMMFVELMDMKQCTEGVNVERSLWWGSIILKQGLSEFWITFFAADHELLSSWQYTKCITVYILYNTTFFFCTVGSRHLMKCGWWTFCALQLVGNQHFVAICLACIYAEPIHIMDEVQFSLFFITCRV